MLSAGLLSATAKACAWNLRFEALRSDAACFAVRPEGLRNNPTLLAHLKTTPSRPSNKALRAGCGKRLGTRNISMLSIKVVR
jgi:hypothetical protein